MSLDWSTGRARATGPMFKHQAVPGVVARATRKTAREKRLQEAYERVDARDKGRCRVTGKHVSANAVDATERREHHHLIPRSRSRAQREDADNIITVSAEVHRLITAGWIDLEGHDASKPIFPHWTKLAKSRPVIIKRSTSRDQAVRGETEK